MDLSRKSCRLCLSETDFNVSLFGGFCRKTNMVDKILVCLKIVVEETDFCNTICYKCAENVERYYNFTSVVKKCQAKLVNEDLDTRRVSESPVNGRHITSYVREQVYDADYTFSFLEVPNEEKKEAKASSPFFSYFSPPNVIIKPSMNAGSWKSPSRVSQKELPRRDERFKRHCRDPETSKRPRHHSRDLFESQSQDVEEEQHSLAWKLTPDENILNRVRDKCFGRSDFK